MPSTPNYALPYPALPDPPDTPADMKALADAVDTALTDTDAAATALDTRVTNVEGRVDTAESKLAALGLQGTDLPQANPGSAGAWLNWGSILTFPNPGRTITVLGQANCTFFNNSAGSSDGFLRVGISLDGGATWSYGTGPGATFGSSVGVSATVAASKDASGTPTSSVLVRAQIRVLHTSTSVGPGHLAAQMAP